MDGGSAFAQFLPLILIFLMSLLGVQFMAGGIA